MGQYNSTYDFEIEESSNKKNDRYYFKGNTTTIPLKFYRYNYEWGYYVENNSDDIFSTYLLL